MHKLFHFLHYTDKSCYGYDNYLKQARNGKWFVFNSQFLIFQALFFIFHKMYLEAFLYTMLISYYFIILYFNPVLAISLFFSTIILFSFFAYKIYEVRNTRVMHKLHYDPVLFTKKITPSNFPIVNLIRVFLMCIPLAWAFSVPLFLTFSKLIPLK